MNHEKSKFDEVLDKAKAKRDELADKTSTRKAKDLKKEADEAAARPGKRNPAT